MKILTIECEVPEDIEFPAELASISYWSSAYLYHKVPVRSITARIEERDEPNKVQPSS